MTSGRKTRGEWSASFQKNCKKNVSKKSTKKKKASDRLLDYQSDSQSEYDSEGGNGSDSESEMNLSKSSLDPDDMEDEDDDGEGDKEDDGSSCDGSSKEITVGTRFTQTFTVGKDSTWTGTILSLPVEEGGNYTVKYDGKAREYTISESKLCECKILGSSGSGKGSSTKPTTFDEEEEEELTRAKPAEKGTKRIRLSWEERQQQIEEFEEAYGHINVPTDSKNFPSLGRFMGKCREYYRAKHNVDPKGKQLTTKKKKPRGTLTDEQEKWLEDKDFEWFPGVGQANEAARKKIDAINHQKWEVMYQELVSYQRKHGNCQVSTENAKLTKWVTVQRQKYRKLNGKKYTDSQRGSITQVQVDLLNKIGFVWDPTGCTAKHEQEKAKKFTRKIVIDTGHTQLTDEEMKAMAGGDTSGIVQEDVPHLAAWPREDALVEEGYEGICPALQRLPTERLLARPCIGDDNGLAPELLALWRRNMCKTTCKVGTQLPFRMLPRDKRVHKPGEDYTRIQIDDSDDDDDSVSEEEAENEEDVEPFPELIVDLHLGGKESSRATKAARRRKARRGPQSNQPKLELANIPKIPTVYTYDGAETVNGFGIRWPSVQSALARRRNRRGRRYKYPDSWCFAVDLDKFDDDGSWLCIEASECPPDPNWYNPRWTNEACVDEATGSGGSDDEEEDGNSFGGRTTHDIDFGDDETSANTTSYRPRVTESPQAGTSSNEDDKHSESEEEEDDVVPLESQDARDITETTQTVDQTRQLYKIIKEGESKRSSVEGINGVRDEFYTHVKRWMASRVISMDDNELKAVKGLVDGLEEAINDWEEFNCDEVDTMFYTDACRRIIEQARSTLS